MDLSHRLHAAAASFWREWHRDLRRHAADDRLPYPIRVRLREAAERAFRRSATQDVRAIVPRWNRRAIRAAPLLTLSSGEQLRGRRLAAEAGISTTEPTVIVEGLHRLDTWTAAAGLLRRGGYQIVRFADEAVGPVPAAGIVDLLPRARSVPPLEKYLLTTSAFVVCASAELQQAASLAGIPVLRLGARDPFTAYPIRANGLFTLATAVDLDTGRALAVADLLTAPYFRNARNCGYRPTGAADVAAAISEMMDGVRGGWRDSAAQARFRDAVAAAGMGLASDVPDVIEWDAAAGFVGDGRLARVQAERAL